MGLLDALQPAAPDADAAADAAPPPPPPPPPFAPLDRARALADVQLQGAISDFHPIRDALRAPGALDALLVRRNEEDAYGDGGNYEARGGAVCLCACVLCV
jgi:hypothetical protein